MLTGLLGIISLAIGALKLCTWAWDKLFSKSARLERIQGWLEQQKVRLIEAKAKQQRQEAEIDAKPDKSDQALADDLNKHFGEKKP